MFGNYAQMKFLVLYQQQISMVMHSIVLIFQKWLDSGKYALIGAAAQLGMYTFKLLYCTKYKVTVKPV